MGATGRCEALCLRTQGTFDKPNRGKRWHNDRGAQGGGGPLEATCQIKLGTHTTELAHYRSMSERVGACCNKRVAGRAAILVRVKRETFSFWFKIDTVCSC